MATTGNSNESASKNTITLTLNDILSDLDKLPAHSSSAQTEQTASGQYTRTPLPESSESVDSSIELSQRFIESSRRVLQDTHALDAAKARLDKVEELLKEVEDSVRP